MKYLQNSILIMLFGLSSFLFGHKALAQETLATPLMNVIKFNPLALVGETMAFGYERVLNKKLSVEVTGNFTYTGRLGAKPAMNGANGVEGCRRHTPPPSSRHYRHSGHGSRGNPLTKRH